MAGVTIPITSQFSVPVPLGRFTSLEALAGNPFGSGALHLLDRPRGALNCDAFGYAWQVTFVPPGVGQNAFLPVTTYDRVVGQVLEVYEDIGATTYNGRVTNIQQDEGRVWFESFPAERITLWVYPGCEINMYWWLIL